MFIKENKKTVEIQMEDVILQGNLAIPENATGIVLFSHGSGSSRLSPRNNYVAEVLQQKGQATLLSDLLTEKEDRIYENRFNIDLLTERLIAITKWVKENPETKGLNLGYFGASTGAASALVAAAYFGDEIKAVVSRGGRPDLGMRDIHKVKAPTLLIVGGYDDLVIQLNQKAYEKLQCERKFEIVPEASHLFEEPGKLEIVARLSADWFSKCL
ncbi:MAG: dienelactone hydrolase family protein [Flavobacteriaceae bacterium]|nr:dienelactone hydrolase family protein [Flavobacteriaceae bacterium]